jgi:hypothetical protein
VENIPGHRDHRSGHRDRHSDDHDQLIGIIPERVIAIISEPVIGMVRNPQLTANNQFNQNLLAIAAEYRPI